jgi:psp operon transcriptional activator
MAAELGWGRWPGFSKAAMETLVGHEWPGNVRELRNVVERAVYRWEDPEHAIDAIEFDPFASPWKPRGEAARSMSPSAPASHAVAPVAVNDDLDCDDFKSACEAHERKLLEAALRRCRFNQRLTAKALALTYDQLRHALRRHDLLQAGGT